MSQFFQFTDENNNFVWILHFDIIAAVNVTPVKNMSVTTAIYSLGDRVINVSMSLSDLRAALVTAGAGTYILDGVDAQYGQPAFVLIDTVQMVRYVPPNLYFFSLGPTPVFGLKMSPENYNVFASVSGRQLF